MCFAIFFLKKVAKTNENDVFKLKKSCVNYKHIHLELSKFRWNSNENVVYAIGTTATHFTVTFRILHIQPTEWVESLHNNWRLCCDGAKIEFLRNERYYLQL